VLVSTLILIHLAEATISVRNDGGNTAAEDCEPAASEHVVVEGRKQIDFTREFINCASSVISVGKKFGAPGGSLRHLECPRLKRRRESA
jgi:hypothetical protein